MTAMAASASRPTAKKALAALVFASLADAKFLQMPFTSEFDNFGSGTYGPDGPWHAVAALLGNLKRESHLVPLDGPLVSLWPTAASMSAVHSTEAGGTYDTTRSGNATKPFAQIKEASFQTSENDVATIFRFAELNSNHTSGGFMVVDAMTFTNLRFEEPGYANVQATTYVMNSSVINYPNNRAFKPTVGILGFGRPSDLSFRGTSILVQMKEAGLISSSSFGLHIASVPLRQRGSLILGGYDQSRVIGPVGVFDKTTGFASTYLKDVSVGFEADSEFSWEEQSVWPNPVPDEASRVASTRFMQPDKNGIIAIPNPAVPGIYLPSPICANAAKQLPVVWKEDLGYYLWDTSDPRYDIVMNFGGYMAFTFLDSQDTNITIKVPFKLLNLTLEAPIVDEPALYFPCHATNSHNTGVWELGRAFLQAAFFGVNYDTNVTFLAQAPGPDMAQSAIQSLEPEDRNMAGMPVAAFVNSWRKQWPELVIPDSKSTLSSGALAGIVVGGLVGVGLLIAACWLFWRQRQRRRGSEQLSDSETKSVSELDSGSREDARECPYPEHPFVEIGDNTVMELDSKNYSEAPSSPGVYEMPADNPFVDRERDRDKEKEKEEEREKENEKEKEEESQK
ncbi:aspartic peptidase domain-containing protein [Triangularia verruculosa]|uniref:Aspartic peptidase domain-containing protein n=1 Tax=Triangularia verruculosa TaxID=2587418 RepID=A0AAN6XWI2_9PEZI|nr:aspartic peptidase domain-containing protein [Triangularia verruculosa]